MTRLKALEAVAEAARKLETAVACKDRLLHHPQRALRAALLTLDALPADPAPAEVVEVAVELWVHKDGDICVLLPGSFIARDWETSRFRRRLGATRLPLVKGDEA
jgi:hypothetical protein